MTRLRALVVGAGEMGKAWARAADGNRDVTVVGWVDLCPERAERGVTELGLKNVWIGDDLSTALERCTPDFVIDVTAPEAHHAVTARCLDARVPVLGEKPMASTIEEAKDLVARAQANTTLFVVSQNRRYHPGLVAFRQLCITHLGRIGQLNAEFYRAPRLGGFRDEMDSPLLLDMAIHTFDAARFIIGSDPVSVHCVEFNPPWSWYRGAASAVAEFEFAGGTRFSYEGSWCAHGHPTSWESSWRVLGERGSAVWDGVSRPVAELVLEDSANRSLDEKLERIESEPMSIAGDGILGSLADFISAMRTGMVPMNECHDNLKSFAMVMAALESSHAGQRVRVDI